MLWEGSYCQKVPVKSGKREGTEELRQSSVSCHGKPQYCIYCQTRNVYMLKTCGKCGVVKYCSKVCQRRHYQSHKKICDTIFHLSNQKKKKVVKMSQYQANLTPKEQKTLIGLIGKQNVVKLYMNDKPVDILRDTGANIIIISKEYVNDLLPNVVIKKLHDILSDADKLPVRWGNQEIIPYEGYIELEVSLDNNTPANEILVPFLIIPERLHYPTLGTNAIEDISQNYQSNELADVLKECQKPQELSNVKTPKHHVTIPAGVQVSVKCNMDQVVSEEKIPVAFEREPFENEDLIPIPYICLTRRGIQNYITVPVLNRCNHDIILPPNTSIGLVNQIQSVTPIEQVHITEKEKEKLVAKNQHKMAVRHHIRDKSINKEKKTSNEKHVDKILEVIDLSHLSTEQHQKAVDLITEMSDVFCQDSEDIGDVQNCKMKIRLKDETPVQKSYYSMPKPLHQEVKHYVEDLLNKGWITKSSSNYSSPVVAVRKKDGSLRLCWDYRALSNKTISDRHPLPRVQDAIDSLNGKKWFSLLDQQKAYHQIYLDPESCPLTTFITPWGLYE